jgi:hypothetical protein
VSLTVKLPATLATDVYTINVAENRADSSNEAFGSVQFNV